MRIIELGFIMLYAFERKIYSMVSNSVLFWLERLPKSSILEYKPERYIAYKILVNISACSSLFRSAIAETGTIHVCSAQIKPKRRLLHFLILLHISIIR